MGTTGSVPLSLWRRPGLWLMAVTAIGLSSACAVGSMSDESVPDAAAVPAITEPNGGSDGSDGGDGAAEDTDAAGAAEDDGPAEDDAGAGAEDDAAAAEDGAEDDAGAGAVDAGAGDDLSTVACDDSPARSQGSWELFPATCGLALGSAPMVWTADRLVVWGGELQSETEWTDRGAVYDPVAQRWSDMAPSPLPPVSGHAMVAVDGQVFVCCGRNRSGPKDVAALYDPQSDRWTEVTPAPGGAEMTGAVWTGQEVLLPQRFASYDPATDRWSTMARPPGPIQPGSELVWTGRHLVVWNSNYRTDSFFLYDPEADRWEELPPQPADARAWHGRMVWAGDQLIVWGDDKNANGRSVGWRLNLDDRTWTAMAPAPGDSPAWGEGTPGSNDAIWTGSELVVWTGELRTADQGMTAMLGYDPTGDSWRQLPPAPGRSYGPRVVWADGQVIVGTDPVMSFTP